MFFIIITQEFDWSMVKNYSKKMNIFKNTTFNITTKAWGNPAI
jgi:hypothetical protein